MHIDPPFYLREACSNEIVDLLEQTTLGTNGAKYRHLDTRKRIHEADHPLFLTLERNKKVLGNITFCRRGKSWYIRYFAFDVAFQSGTKRTSKKENDSGLKRQLSAFFDEVFSEKNKDEVSSMYAYIEPKNDRSKWMSQHFGFHKIATLATQTFSRVKPRSSDRLFKIEDGNEIREVIQKNYSGHRFYFDHFLSQPPYYVLRDSKNQILAAARITIVNWQIVRLPGRFGNLLVTWIPYIPFLKKLVRPKNHQFMVPDAVFVKDNDPVLLQELFSAMLHHEKLNLLLWWMDSTDPLYLSVKHKVRWGLLHRIVGAAPVDVMERANRKDVSTEDPVFVAAFDMV